MPIESAADSRTATSTFVRVPCPSCGNPEQRHEYALRHSAIVSCVQCAFTYVSPRIRSDLIQAKIQSWAEQDVVDAERLRIALDENTMRLYRQFLSRVERGCHSGGRRMLDVGCATGAFCAAARDAGWQVSGIEIGVASAMYARDTFGLDVSTGSVYDVEFLPGEFDCIACLEVIEHLEDPFGALQRFASWLKPGGVLLLSTPNYESLYRRLHGAGWWVVNCEDEHIMFFTMESLASMVQRAGFTAVWRHIRGIDFLGILRQYRNGSATARDEGEANGYYDSRSAKERLKAVLGRVGLLGVIRTALRGLDATYSIRWSPLYAMGEQLVLAARKDGA